MRMSGRWGRGIAVSLLAWMVPGGAALATDMVTANRTAFQAVCAGHGGAFDQAWHFDDAAASWGCVITCTADTLSITCAGEACAARRGGASATDEVLTFAAEPGAFDYVLNATRDDRGVSSRDASGRR